MKAKFCLAAAVVLVAWGMKRHHADARVEDLMWILGPTARLVAVATGTQFVLQPGEGYLSRERLFLIEKSCAGVNFMVAAFAMSAFVLGHTVQSAFSGVRAFGLSLLASYSAALVVNAVRITIAVWLAAHPLPASGPGAADIHRLEGIAVYFGGLVLLHELMQLLDRRGAARDRQDRSRLVDACPRDR